MMRIRFSIAGLIIFVFCGATSPEQNFQPEPDANKASVLIMKNGDWRWVKELKRNGPMFEFYEETGQNVKRERYVSIPVNMVDADAVTDVNASLIELRSACSKGEAAKFEVDLEGRARRIFVELAIRGAAYDGTSTERYGDCFFSTPMWKEMERQAAAAATPVPTSTPTPRPTRTPPPRPGEIVCRLFEGIVKMSGERLEVSLNTDLPDDTDLMVSIGRTYRARGENGVETYSANSLSEKSTVGEWKRVHPVDVSSERLIQVLNKEVQRIQRYGIRHDVVDGSVSKDIEVSFIVPVNQTNPAFGRSNANLSGPAVIQDGNMRLIRWERLIPISLPTSRGNTASPKYQVAKTESYTASVAGRFESGSKVHVVTQEWDRVEDIAKEIASGKPNRAVTVFFWNNASEVGTQAATYGVELINGRVEDILVDNR